jgi:hypothetical protein
MYCVNINIRSFHRESIKTAEKTLKWMAYKVGLNRQDVRSFRESSQDEIKEKNQRKKGL